MRTTRRMQAVQTPVISVVGELIRANPGTISLGQGVVSYPPPPQAMEQIAGFAASSDNHKYQLVQGISPLLEAIEAKLASDNHITLNDNNSLIVTAGGNMAFMNAILAIADEGDEIILQTPYYFNHEMAVGIAGCAAVCVATDENYQLRLDEMEKAISPKTRAIVTISPNNPSGAVYPAHIIEAVNELCAQRGLYHIHDEAYEYFTYDGAEHFSPGSIAGSEGHTISLFSLSKSYGFASWRIGYMAIPRHLYMDVKKIQDTILICPPVISQWAAVGAMKAGSAYCREKLKAIGQVRNVVLDALTEISDIVTVPPSQGAFYFLLRVNTEMDSESLVERLIRDHKVAVIPGATFGIDKGCFLRVAYAAMDKVAATEGIGRLATGLRAIIGD